MDYIDPASSDCSWHCSYRAARPFGQIGINVEGDRGYSGNRPTECLENYRRSGEYRIRISHSYRLILTPALGELT